MLIAHIAEILSGEIRLDDFHFLNLTGGFLDGDDSGERQGPGQPAEACRSGRHRRRAGGAVHPFHTAGKLILGVCNGFQADGQDGHAARF